MNDCASQSLHVNGISLLNPAGSKGEVFDGNGQNDLMSPFADQSKKVRNSVNGCFWKDIEMELEEIKHRSPKLDENAIPSVDKTVVECPNMGIEAIVRENPVTNRMTLEKFYPDTVGDTSMFNKCYHLNELHHNVKRRPNFGLEKSDPSCDLNSTMIGNSLQKLTSPIVYAQSINGKLPFLNCQGKKVPFAKQCSSFYTNCNERKDKKLTVRCVKRRAYSKPKGFSRNNMSQKPLESTQHCVNLSNSIFKVKVENSLLSPVPILCSKQLCIRRSGKATKMKTRYSKSRNIVSKRCTVDGCDKGSRSRGLCKRHGGGKRCLIKSCIRSDQGGGFCIAHGGGKRCLIDKCESSAQSRGLCKKHGGGRRCKVQGCSKSSQELGLCRSHGGGKYCIHENCYNRRQISKFCKDHSKSIKKE